MSRVLMVIHFLANLFIYSNGFCAINKSVINSYLNSTFMKNYDNVFEVYINIGILSMISYILYHYEFVRRRRPNFKSINEFLSDSDSGYSSSDDESNIDNSDEHENIQ